MVFAIGYVLSLTASAGWLVLWSSAIQALAPELTGDPRLWLVGLIDVGMVVAGIIVAVLFFKKKRIAVRAVICLMVASILASLVQALLGGGVLGHWSAKKDVVVACVVAAVWIPYFLMSRRVKNTFIEWDSLTDPTLR